MKRKLFKGLISVCTAVMILSASTVNASTLKNDRFGDNKSITVEYFGHSCFGISDSEGVKIVTDPYDPIMGYTFPADISTEILTISHNHFDHNYLMYENLLYKQLYFSTIGSFEYDGIKIKGIPSWHDNEQGTLRGLNTIYTFEINNIKICHLGDLGHQLSKEQIKSIGKVDVLMIPVGGNFTIDPAEAVKVINSINPNVIIPMHYGADGSYLKDYLAPLDNFISKAKQEGWKIENEDKLTLNNQMLNTMKSKKVYVLNYNH